MADGGPYPCVAARLGRKQACGTDGPGLAEALEGLEPEQKAGFFAFMRQVQDRIESQNMGSREAANERLIASEGKSLDSYMREEERRQLVDIQIREKIQKRVSVPWRDVRQEYDRFYETFNPPPRLFYRLIQIPKGNAEQLAEFQRLRDAGTPFEKIATDKNINRYKPDTGGLEERQLKGERAEASLFGNALLNKAAQTMAVGQVSCRAIAITHVGRGESWVRISLISPQCNRHRETW